MEDYQVLRIKLTKEQKSHHCLFYKPHKLNSQKADDNAQLSSRTLFVYNVPPYVNDTSLRFVFSCFGKVERVIISSKPSKNPFDSVSSAENQSFFKHRYRLEDDDEEFGIEDKTDLDDEKKFAFKVAYVVFSENEAVARAATKPFLDKFRLLQETNPTNKKKSLDSTIKVGLKRWISDYEEGLINETKLSKEIDEFMQNYDSKKDEQTKNDQESMNQPDEEGWVTVTQKNRKANRPFTEKNIKRIHQKQKKRHQQMQLVNFYSFQMKESKKEYIAQLRKKFEEDKKKIEAMKTSRKFKPF